MFADQNKLDTINTIAHTAFQDAFGSRPEDSFGQWTEVVPVSSGTSVDIAVVETLAKWRKFTGEKKFEGARAFSQNIEIETYSYDVELPLEQVQFDNTGLVERSLENQMSQAANELGQVVYDKLADNPNGFDGVSLLNNSHPHVGGSGTSDNLIGGGLTIGNLRTAIQKFREMKNASGQPLLAQPSHLMVGAADEEKARQYTGSDRPVGVDQDGEVNGSGTAAGATNLRNFTGGNLDVIVNPRITTSDEWYLYDLTQPGLRPMLAFQWQAPELVSKNNPDDDNVFHRRTLLWSVTAVFAPAAGDWRRVVGNT